MQVRFQIDQEVIEADLPELENRDYVQFRARWVGRKITIPQGAIFQTGSESKMAETSFTIKVKDVDCASIDTVGLVWTWPDRPMQVNFFFSWDKVFYHIKNAYPELLRNKLPTTGFDCKGLHEMMGAEGFKELIRRGCIQLSKIVETATHCVYTIWLDLTPDRIRWGTNNSININSL